MSTSATDLRLRPDEIPGHLKQYFEPALCSSCYMCHTIAILCEIRRVLRKDGVVFWNIGDSYATSSAGTSDMEPVTWEVDGKVKKKSMTRIGKVPGLKPKDLCLIPFRVAIAAQEDGWWVRSDIIWSKPNPMPESVTDRPTNSHEYILMLTKSKNYYWDADAVREKYTEPLNRWGGDSKKLTDNLKDDSPYATAHRERDMRPNENGRNLRSVWSFPTQPYPEAHFAVFPEKLPETCIKAATPEVGCCSKCGAPWVRLIENTGHVNTREPAYVPNNTPSKTDSTGWGPTTMATDNWQPACKCNAEKVPSVVLDPFAGASTTLVVAKRLGRQGIGYELSSDYCELSKKRIVSTNAPLPGLFV